MTLTVVDSLGVEYGDATQLFGSIAGAGFISYDEFVVLDNVMKTVRRYSRSVEHLGSVEYQGSGPLEIVNAGHLCPFEGGIAVLEQYLPPKCLIFDSSMSPRQYITIQENAPLFEPWILEDSTIASGIYSIRNNGELVFSCECEGLPGNEMFRFSITDNGYLAYSMHPLDYPKVYILELSDR